MVSTALDAKVGAQTILARRIGTRMATAVLLIEGFVSVSIQMIVLRQLVPVVGYSINVTSIVITTFLGALAFGYRSGGRLRGDIRKRIQQNLILVALLSAIGLSYWIVEYVFGIYFEFFASALIGVTLYSVIFLAPIVYLLAQTVVLLIEFRQGTAAAEQAGDTFHLSTIGNVVGGLVTTLIVMYYLGIAAAIFINVSLLSFAYLILSERPSIKDASAVVITLLVALVLNVIVERELFLTTTAHGNYAIVDAPQDDGLFLFANGQNASRMDINGVGHPYIEFFEDQLFSSSKGPTDILVLGAGGFTLGQGREDIGNLTYVDVDERLREISDRFLSPQARLGEFVVNDARAFLLRTDNVYDAIVLDTYSHRSAVPAHLVTKEFFSLLRERLTPNGEVLMNFIASDDDQSTFTRGLDNTVRSIFSDCTVHRINTEGVAFHNKLYHCQKRRMDEYSVIYTDHNTRSARDSALQ